MAREVKKAIRMARATNELTIIARVVSRQEAAVEAG